ncbi:MAG: D-amino acid aminotransferase [Gammaproteobacteria bacterium]|nr:D-amino acid aminotransferase [Gammaproteobacteria bacterium]MDE0649250.1 D-amino acid aminotransferase [Gammaproteobacteria bacterium]
MAETTGRDVDAVYLNGEYLPRAEARVAADDRGFLLSDGIYEVTPAYGGRFFRGDRHLARMTRGLAALRIDYDTGRLSAVKQRLLELNGLADADFAYVYMQVTRGTAPRTHYFPPHAVEPTVYAYARPHQRPSSETWGRGYRAITAPDRRWARVDIKSIALLPNVLAMQAAVDTGVDDVILVRDGVAIEGAHSNFFAVRGGALVTHPATHQILHGITREYVLELAAGLGIPVELRPLAVEELASASEAFLTGTTTEVHPIVEIDGRPVGDGRVGPLAKRLSEAFRKGLPGAA